MTNSRSSASRNSLWAALIACCAVLGVAQPAGAERKRVVVLELEGPKGARFHDDLVKLIKKTHTVVPTEKWNGTAEELDASASSEKNFKKVARRLKVDAIVEGKIEKRRDEFIIRLKLREGRSGALIGSAIDTKADGPRIDGKAQRDLKDELVDAIGNVGSNRASAAGGGGDDEDDDDRPANKPTRKTDDDDRPARKAARKTGDEDDDARPVAKKAGKRADGDRSARKGSSKHADDERGDDRKAGKKTDDDDAPVARRAGKKTDDDAPVAKKAGTKLAEDDDALPPRKPVASKADDDDDLPANKPTAKAAGDDRRGKKAVAASDDDAEVDAQPGEPVKSEAALSPGERALDAVVGLSVTSRQLAFNVRSGLTDTPPAYKGAPVAGALFDATLYPFAVGHKRSGVLKNLGIEAMYDRVIEVSTKANGKSYDSKETRFGIAGVVRYPFGRTATSPVLLATFGYSSQLFSISSGTAIGIPNVKYTILEPGAGLRYPATSKITFALDAKLMLITDTGQIQDTMQYGAANVLGFEGAAGVDYLITHNIFVRAAFRYETIGYTFKGTGVQSNGRDGDPATLDVPGARDSYIGGTATVGYVY